MRKFKIIVTGHQLKNQIVAKGGTIVDESQLNNNADELVKQGFIELVEEDSVKEDSQAEKDRLAKQDTEAQAEKEDSKQLELVEEKEVKTETKVSKK